MTKRSSLLAVGSLAAVAIAFGADISTDYDHHADFSRVHTYSWLGVQAGSSLWQDRIQRAVDAQLSAKGWQRVDSGGDATVSAFGRVTEQQTLETFYNGFGGGWGWRGWGGMGMGMSTTEAVPEKVGNLTVDIFMSGTKQLMWRGRASNAIGVNAEKNDKKMEESVEKMFKKFPPAEKG